MVDLYHIAGLNFMDVCTHAHYDNRAYFGGLISQLGDHWQKPRKLDPSKISHYTVVLYYEQLGRGDCRDIWSPSMKSCFILLQLECLLCECVLHNTASKLLNLMIILYRSMAVLYWLVILQCHGDSDMLWKLSLFFIQFLFLYILLQHYLQSQVRNPPYGRKLLAKFLILRFGRDCQINEHYCAKPSALH